jgi:hypothetical protein
VATTCSSGNVARKAWQSLVAKWWWRVADQLRRALFSVQVVNFLTRKMVPLSVMKYILLYICFIMDEMKRDLFLDRVLEDAKTPVEALRVLCIVHGLGLLVSLVSSWTIHRIHSPNLVFVSHVTRTFALYMLLDPEYTHHKYLYIALYILNAREYLLVEFLAPRYRKSRLVDTAYSMVACLFVEFYRRNVRSHPLPIYDIRASLLLILLTAAYMIQTALNVYICPREVRLPTEEREPAPPSAPLEPIANTAASPSTTDLEAQERLRVIKFLLEISERLDSQHDETKCEPGCCTGFRYPTPSSFLSPSIYAKEQHCLPANTRLAFSDWYHPLMLIVSYVCREIGQYNLMVYIMYIATTRDTQFVVDPDENNLVTTSFRLNYFLIIYYGACAFTAFLYSLLGITGSPTRLKFFSILTLVLSAMLNVCVGFMEMSTLINPTALISITILLAFNESLRSVYVYPYIYRRAMDRTILTIMTAAVSGVILFPFYVWRLRIALLPLVFAALQTILFVSGFCAM